MNAKPPESTELARHLQERFASRVKALRSARQEAQLQVDSGVLPSFPEASSDLRDSDWKTGQHVLPDENPTRLDIGTALTDRYSGVHFDLSGIETRDEAILWRDVFAFVESVASQKHIVVTMIVDTLQAAFHLEEIVYELRDHVAALRWDREAYLLSFIRTFHAYPEFVLPDRSELEIGAPFLRALGKHALRIGERRGIALTGFPAPPTDSPNPVESADLLQIHVGKITEHGVRENLQLALQYLEAGTAGDVSAELALAQLWQWTYHATGVLDEGHRVNYALLDRLLGDEAAAPLLEHLARFRASDPFFEAN